MKNVYIITRLGKAYINIGVFSSRKKADIKKNYLNKVGKHSQPYIVRKIEVE